MQITCWDFLLKQSTKISSELNSTPVELIFPKVAGLPQLSRQLATNGSDLSILLQFVQFVKLSFRFYSHTVIEHNFFLEFLCYYLFIELESEFNCGAKVIRTYKINRTVCALSLINIRELKKTRRRRKRERHLKM